MEAIRSRTQHRIRGLDSVVGQWRAKKLIRRSMKSAQVRGATFPHTLLHGIGGLGKTMVARAIAEDLGYHFEEIEAAALKHRQNVIDVLRNGTERASAVNKPLLLLVDEIHNLTRKMQEALYYPMIEFRITSMERGTSTELQFPAFTLIGATTRRDELDFSFESRFELEIELDLYSELAIMQILKTIFVVDDIFCGLRELRLVAMRCLGIPRRATMFAKKIRDQVLSRGGLREVTKEDVYQTFMLEDIDEIGLGKLHVKYLSLLLSAQPHPIGITALSGRLGRQDDVIRGTIEPILLRLGLISCTPRGRVITDSGYKHLANSGLA